MENAFTGKMYIAPVGDFSSDPTYLTATGWTLDKDTGITAKALATVHTPNINSGLVIDTKASASWEDGNLVKTTTLEEVTGKATIAISSASYNTLTKSLQGVECDMRILAADIDTFVQVVGFKPHFAPTTKIGDVQMAEMTFSYKQAASISPENKRYRIIEAV